MLREHEQGLEFGRNVPHEALNVKAGVINVQAEVMECIKPTKLLLGNVFSRLQLKGQKFKVFSAASKEEMVEFVSQLKKIDEEFDSDILLDSSRPCKLTEQMKEFMKKHCLCGQYQFSINKCGAQDCVCGLPRTSPDTFVKLHHLPFPVPQQEKYKHFEVRP